MTWDKIALITGVSREMGFGYETAKRLASLGYKVIITAGEIQKSKITCQQNKCNSNGFGHYKRPEH